MNPRITADIQHFYIEQNSTKLSFSSFIRSLILPQGCKKSYPTSMGNTRANTGLSSIAHSATDNSVLAM